MSDPFLAVIKLISGEEVVAKVSYLDDEERILLECPAVMNSTSSRSLGVNLIKIEPWIKTGKETIYILDMNKVVTISEVFDKEVTKVYTKFVLAYYYEEEPTRENKITKQMGYLSSVKEARATLEKIFNNS